MVVGVAGHLGVGVPEAAVPVRLSQSDGVSILRPSNDGTYCSGNRKRHKICTTKVSTLVEKIKSMYTE